MALIPENVFGDEPVKFLTSADLGFGDQESQSVNNTVGTIYSLRAPLAPPKGGVDDVESVGIISSSTVETKSEDNNQSVSSNSEHGDSEEGDGCIEKPTLLTESSSTFIHEKLETTVQCPQTLSLLSSPASVSEDITHTTSEGSPSPTYNKDPYLHNEYEDAFDMAGNMDSPTRPGGAYNYNIYGGGYQPEPVSFTTSSSPPPEEESQNSGRYQHSECGPSPENESGSDDEKSRLSDNNSNDNATREDNAHSATTDGSSEIEYENSVDHNAASLNLCDATRTCFECPQDQEAISSNSSHFDRAMGEEEDCDLSSDLHETCSRESSYAGGPTVDLNIVAPTTLDPLKDDSNHNNSFTALSGEYGQRQSSVNRWCSIHQELDFMLLHAERYQERFVRCKQSVSSSGRIDLSHPSDFSTLGVSIIKELEPFVEWALDNLDLVETWGIRFSRCNSVDSLRKLADELEDADQDNGDSSLLLASPLTLSSLNDREGLQTLMSVVPGPCCCWLVGEKSSPSNVGNMNPLVDAIDMACSSDKNLSEIWTAAISPGPVSYFLSLPRVHDILLCFSCILVATRATRRFGRLCSFVVESTVSLQTNCPASGLLRNLASWSSNCRKCVQTSHNLCTPSESTLSSRNSDRGGRVSLWYLEALATTSSWDTTGISNHLETFLEPHCLTWGIESDDQFKSFAASLLSASDDAYSTYQVMGGDHYLTAAQIASVISHVLVSTEVLLAQINSVRSHEAEWLGQVSSCVQSAFSSVAYSWFPTEQYTASSTVITGPALRSSVELGYISQLQKCAIVTEKLVATVAFDTFRFREFEVSASGRPPISSFFLVVSTFLKACSVWASNSPIRREAALREKNCDTLSGQIQPSDWAELLETVESQVENERVVVCARVFDSDVVDNSMSPLNSQGLLDKHPECHRSSRMLALNHNIKGETSKTTKSPVPVLNTSLDKVSWLRACWNSAGKSGAANEDTLMVIPMDHSPLSHFVDISEFMHAMAPPPRIPKKNGLHKTSSFEESGVSEKFPVARKKTFMPDSGGEMGVPSGPLQHGRFNRRSSRMELYERQVKGPNKKQSVLQQMSDRRQHAKQQQAPPPPPPADPLSPDTTATSLPTKNTSASSSEGQAYEDWFRNNNTNPGNATPPLPPQSPPQKSSVPSYVGGTQPPTFSPLDFRPPNGEDESRRNSTAVASEALGVASPMVIRLSSTCRDPYGAEEMFSKKGKGGGATPFKRQASLMKLKKSFSRTFNFGKKSGTKQLDTVDEFNQLDPIASSTENLETPKNKDGKKKGKGGSGTWYMHLFKKHPKPKK